MTPEARGQWEANSGRHELLPPRLLRRRFLTAISLAGISTVGLAELGAQSPARPSPAPSTTKSNGLLVRPQGVRQLETRSKIVLELEGQLQIKEPDPNKDAKSRTAEVKGKSTLDYFERIALDDASYPLAAARSYVEAGVENWISGSASSYQLRRECQQTRMLQHDGLWQQYCATTPLDAREVELLHSPINSAVLEVLLPREPAKPQANWSIGAEQAQQLFNLDAVHKTTLRAQVTKVEKGIATIELSGDLEATANSVPTRLSIQGNFHAKLASQCALVTWVGIIIKEERQISQAEPGFSITARIRMIREETPSGLSVDDSELRQLAAQEDAARWLIRLQSTSGRFSLLADRRWQIYLDAGEECILRMIENNTVIAQCNVSRLVAMEAGQQLTLEGLQEDIRASLGKGFGEFLESSESQTSSKLRLMRCVVAGELEEVPIQWVYAHLSDDNGRRMAMIFTMGANVTDRFAAADEQLSSSFEMLPEPSPDEPAPALAPTLAAERKPTESQR